MQLTSIGGVIERAPRSLEPVADCAATPKDKHNVSLLLCLLSFSSLPKWKGTCSQVTARNTRATERATEKPRVAAVKPPRPSLTPTAHKVSEKRERERERERESEREKES